MVPESKWCGERTRELLCEDPGVRSPRVSIYKPAFERAVSDNDATHTVRPRAVAKAFHSPENAVAQEVVCLRKAKPVDHLLPGTIKWLTSLPQEVRPIVLAKRYPRIANVLALDWCRQEACRLYFGDLLLDHRRGNRQGFPLDVHREVETLRDYYDTHPPLN